jgi:hypothetical protein
MFFLGKVLHYGNKKNWIKIENFHFSWKFENKIPKKGILPIFQDHNFNQKT